MFVAMGACDATTKVADDRAVEVLIRNAPTTGNAVYERDIEAPFIASSEAYYRDKCTLWMTQLPTPEYLAKVGLRVSVCSRGVGASCWR